MPISNLVRNRRHALMGASAAATLSAALALSFAGAAFAGDISGRVKDAVSGASLAGAVVTTASGQRVVTDRDGGYTLAGLDAGDVKVNVSFLGYKGSAQTISVPATGAVNLDFALSGAGGEVEGVVVTGRRLAEARALNLQMNAVGVSNVVSADDLGKFPDNNVADAVSRVPGVSVFHNRETGEGEYVTIRGLASDFNAFTVNGERVSNTDNSSRQVSLTVLPPFGLQTVDVKKTSTPDMDGDAIAGTVDFRTPNAFDFNKPVLRLYSQYSYHERAAEHHEPSDGETFQIDAGNVFGVDKRWGVYASAYYLRKNSISEESENDGEWDPNIWRANNQEQIDYRSMHLPGLDLDYYRLLQQRYGGNFSIDYRGENHQFYLRSQFAGFKKRDDHSELIVKSSNTARLEQVNANETDLAQPDQAIIGYIPGKGNEYSYTTGQIVDRDGDGIITDADAGGCDGASDSGSGSRYSLCGKSGVYDPKAFFVDRNFGTNDEDSMLTTNILGGESHFGRLKLTYDAFLSYGERNNPTGYGVEFETPNSGVFADTGVTFTNPDPRFPEWQLPASVAPLVYDNSQLSVFDGLNRRTSFTDERKFGGRFDTDYDMDGQYHLVSLKAGFKFQRQHQDHTEVAYDLTQPDYASLASSGLAGETVGSILSGYYTFGSTISRDALIRAVDAATTGHAEDPTSTTHVQEDIFAEYGMATFKFGKLETITGLRIETTNVDNVGWLSDDDPSKSGFVTTKRSYTEVLPSIFFNYRATSHSVYRAAVWTSFSRPAYQNITAGETISRDGSGQITGITKGNPNLKPAESLNFDLSAEYYLSNAGLISAGVFYKQIKNFIFSNGDTVDGTTVGQVSGHDVDISQPMNGEKAHVFGVEVNFERRFTELPGFWSGFGVAANGTWLDSSAKGGQPYRLDYAIPLLDSPKWLYNLNLFYQKYGAELNLSYNYQGKFIEDIRNNYIDKWNQPYKRMDFHSRYNFKGGLAVGFDVQNILDNYGYYTSKGPYPGYQKDYIEPGRTMLFNVSYSY